MVLIDSNHSEVCKFQADDDLLDLVKRAIGRMADGAIAAMKTTADPQPTETSVSHNRTWHLESA